MKKLFFFSIIIIVGGFVALKLGAYFLQGPSIAQGDTNLRFTEVNTDWVHVSDQEKSLPFGAIAAIDIDGDGIDELFVGGGRGQADAVLKYNGTEFIQMPLSGLDKNSDDGTMGVVSMDVTGDNKADLFVARETGIWFYENQTDTATRAVLLDKEASLPLADNTTPLSIALGDVNKDGWVDLYVSGYIKNELVEGETIFNQEYGGYSHLFLNNGDNTWVDISASAGVWRQHNTFTAAFIDLDNDADSDLVIAQDTGHVEIYSNNGDLTFTPIENPSVYSYPMGLGFGDINNNGLIDLYFSNVGNTLPRALLQGDLTDDQPFNMDYMLYQNDGNLQFSDIGAGVGAADHGFGWGTVIQDMDMDGRADMLVAQNYGRFPGVEYLEPYPGRLLKQYEDGFFRPIEKVSGAANSFFGLTPVVSDFNNDGLPDIAWFNLNGPVRVLLNEGIPNNNWLKVRLNDEPASIGAIVIVELRNGMTLTDQFATSEGLSSDQASDLFFGLGTSSEIATVTVKFQSGHIETVKAPEANNLIRIAQ